MKKAVFVAPTIHEYSDPNNLLELARLTEQAGWDGYFICDHLILDPGGYLGLADPTVTLGAIAAVTEKVIIGAMVTPVSRRRPWKLAKEFASLDQLSNGRLRIGIGLGGLDQEFSNFGEDPDKKVLARKTDEGIAIMEQLHTGEAVNFDGRCTRSRMQGCSRARYNVRASRSGSPPCCRPNPASGARRAGTASCPT